MPVTELYAFNLICENLLAALYGVALKLMLCNIGTFIKAALGDSSGLDKILDRLFYDYNG